MTLGRTLQRKGCLKPPCGGRGGGAKGRAQLTPRKRGRELAWSPGPRAPWEGLLHHHGQHQKWPWAGEEGLQGGGGLGWGHYGFTGARATAWAASALCTPVPLNQASTTCLLSHQACAPPGPTPVGLGDLTGREDGARREGRSYSFSAAETGQRPDRLYPEPRSSQQSKVRAPGRGGGKAPPEAWLTRGRAGRPTSRRPRRHPADTDGGEPAGGGWPSSPNGLLSPHA